MLREDVMERIAGMPPTQAVQEIEELLAALRLEAVRQTNRSYKSLTQDGVPFDEVFSHLGSLRKALGISSEEMARRLELSSPGQVTSRETASAFRIQSLVDYADALGFNVRVVLTPQRTHAARYSNGTV